MELSIERLTKNYKDKIAVDNISISLKPGVYGLLGANGAGKTTIMRMICGIMNSTSGVIKFDGENILDMKERYCDLLGYLPQDFGYYPDFTARDFLLYISEVKGLPKKTVKTSVEELLEIVSLKDVANKRIKTFSGGMKQRLGIAQAMLNDPKILVLDEPTAGLDPKERVRFRNLISSFSKDKIVILSTHIVSDVEYIADQIILMKQGSIIMDGTVNEITSSMQGHVWKCIVSPKEVDKLTVNFCVSNLRNEENDVELRIVSQNQPLPTATPIEPTLEDLYLYHFQEEKAGEKDE
ncbi:MAG: ABC transporter ATP-binding protein [Oscillospiraceae bacterium]